MVNFSSSRPVKNRQREEIDWIKGCFKNSLLSKGRCCIVFEGKRKSLNIQNGVPKFEKFSHFCKISKFCSDLKTKYIFVINMTV